MASFVSLFDPPHGFHPVSVSRLTIQEDSLLNCDLHSYLKLPPEIFADVYELENYASAFTFQHWGTTNLELPVNAVDPAGSAVILHVNNLGRSVHPEIRVPLHARYGQVSPNKTKLETEVNLPWPKVFFLCPDLDLYSKLAHTPPSSLDLPETFSSGLGWSEEAWTKERKLIIPVQHDFSLSSNSLTIPVGSASDLPLVVTGTSLTIIALFLWVGWEIVKLYRRLSTAEKQKSRRA